MIDDENSPINPVAVTVREGELHRLPYPFEFDPRAMLSTESDEQHHLCL